MSIVIQQNVSLAPLTTLKVGGVAAYFVSVTSNSELEEACEYAKSRGLQIRVFGGGSNVLVSDKGTEAFVIQPNFQEFTQEETDEGVFVTVGAGITLDACVEECIVRNLWGLENFSGIPGSVGAVPVQNVGAYGVEAKDFVHAVIAYDPHAQTFHTFDTHSCAFGYRDSFFKHGGRDLIIVSVTFKLSSVSNPRIGYRDLAEHFKGNESPSLHDIRNAVLHIRSGKFPDWHVVGTAGSFFKNPIVSPPQYEELRERFPQVPGFPHGDNVKIPLGWVLDKILNVRGYREGNVGLYDKQALVLVNYGGATAEEIEKFSDAIVQKIFSATSLRIEREVVTFA